MILNLNLSSYFNQKHGVDDEIYWYLRDISKFFSDKNYSELIDTVGLMPIIMPKDIARKEKVQFDFRSKLAIISKQIDYEDYLHSNIEGRKKMMVKNILDSIKAIKAKGKFDYETFKKDLLEYNYVISDL